jgi:hypothetical protein
MSTPRRPSNVPDDAVYFGGRDAGYFIQLVYIGSTPLASPTYPCKIYDAEDGTLIVDAEFKPEGAADALKSEPAGFVSWDGESLILADGKVLLEIQSANE